MAGAIESLPPHQSRTDICGCLADARQKEPIRVGCEGKPRKLLYLAKMNKDQDECE